MSLDKLADAISIAKSGDKVTAGKLLSEYVRGNQSNETAWLWLSICVSAPDQKRYCLNRAIAINPNNENSRKALAQLDVPPPSAPTFTELSNNQPVSSFDALHKSSEPESLPVKTTSNQKNSPPLSLKTKMPVVPMENVGAYVKSILLPSEKVLATAKLHWIIFISNVLLVLLLSSPVLFFLIIPISLFDDSLSTTWYSILWISFLLIVGIGVVIALLKYKTTEFALTDKRIIGKVGIFRRDALELILGKVESISVNQGIIGQILGYGTLVISGTGGTHQRFPYIATPMEMKQKINSILGE